MPKPVRNPEEIEATKARILDSALDLLVQEGFKNLSMRKLAAGTAMTAANIYNYFSNKDEIYLAVQTRGFEILRERIRKIDKDHSDTPEKLKIIAESYMDFGMNNPEYYEVMFTRNTPKFTDYKGTSLEPSAEIEKRTALDVFDLVIRVIARVMGNNPAVSILGARYRAIQIWTALHGIVSLHNSRVLQETDAIGIDTMGKLIDDVLFSLFHEPA